MSNEGMITVTDAEGASYLVYPHDLVGREAPGSSKQQVDHEEYTNAVKDTLEWAEWTKSRTPLVPKDLPDVVWAAVARQYGADAFDEEAYGLVNAQCEYRDAYTAVMAERVRLGRIFAKLAEVNPHGGAYDAYQHALEIVTTGATDEEALNG